MKKMNYKLFISVILLGLFGCVMIYSASYIWAEYKYNNPYKFVINQSIFYIIGVILMIIVSKINKIVKDTSVIIPLIDIKP